jgi:hypothetical protein
MAWRDASDDVRPRKKKSDKLAGRTIADLLRCNLFPACFVISPELGALRQQMRFRRLLWKKR